ncbi:MAG TPA: IPT/TIG domain-containing protein, partial [Microlunatus sp.]|nr:IPT/TIG domain-containing protein [Microlunatus sp.]
PSTGAAVSSAGWSVSGTGGTAQGDEPSVTLDVFSGTATSGAPVSSTSASLSSGAWSTTVSGLAAGTYTLVASQRDTAGNTGRSGPVQVTVAAALTVTSASPTALGQGATRARVVLAGTGFDATSRVAFSGAGVTASVTGWTATQLTLETTVDLAAEAGARNVTVTNGDGRQGTCSGCLAVVLGPKITSVTPSTIRRGGSTTVTITGANFDSQLAVDISGTGVNTGTMRVLSPTTMTVVLRATTSAPLTARSLTVRSRSNLGRNVLANAVTVVA